MQLRNTLLGAAAIVVVVAVVVLATVVKRAQAPTSRAEVHGDDVAPVAATAADHATAAEPRPRGDRSGSANRGEPADSPQTHAANPGAAATGSALQRRVDMVAAIEGSGSAAEVWNEQGGALLRALGAHAVAITNSGCFVAGCAAVVTFSSKAEYERRRAELEATTAFAAWTGSKRWSEPEAIANGQVIVALVLDRPD